MSNVSRRVLLQAATAAVLAPPLASAAETACEALAGETIRWIVPYSPGGSYDFLSRVLEGPLERELGAEIAIGNRTGAGGLIGARTLRDARSDGRTLGIVNSSGLIGAALAGEQDVPSPDGDFTVLGRMMLIRHVWVTRADSPYRTIEDVLAAPPDRPVLFAVAGVGSTFFISAAVLSEVLGLNARFVAGHTGGKAVRLAVIRGDVDILSIGFSSILKQIESGQLRPLLQIADTPIADHPSLRGVPLLTGPQGIAAERVHGLGGDPKAAARKLDALVALLAVGRTLAAPAGLPPDLTACLRDAVARALASPAFREAASRAGFSLSDPASPDAAMRLVREAAAGARILQPILKRAFEEIRS